MNRTSKRPTNVAAAWSGSGVDFLLAGPSPEESSEDIKTLEPEDRMKAVTEPIAEALKQEIAKIDISKFKNDRVPEDLDAGE